MQFRVQIEIVGRPSLEDCKYFESVTALACKTMRRMANSQRFTGFDGIEVLEKAGDLQSQLAHLIHCHFAAPYAVDLYNWLKIAYGKDRAAEVNSVDNVLQFVLITPEQ